MPAIASTAKIAARETTPAVLASTPSRLRSMIAVAATGRANRTLPKISVVWCAAAAAKVSANPLSRARPLPSRDHSYKYGNAFR